jgi:hypothetical protein
MAKPSRPRAFVTLAGESGPERQWPSRRRRSARVESRETVGIADRMIHDLALAMNVGRKGSTSTAITSSSRVRSLMYQVSRRMTWCCWRLNPGEVLNSSECGVSVLILWGSLAGLLNPGMFARCVLCFAVCFCKWRRRRRPPSRPAPWWPNALVIAGDDCPPPWQRQLARDWGDDGHLYTAYGTARRRYCWAGS